MSNNVINVIVTSKKPVQVTANDTGTIITSSAPVTLRNIPVITRDNSGNVNIRVEELTNVNAGFEANGATLVYDTIRSEFVVRQLSLKEITDNLDGGTF